ncbi:hypothetical protein PCANC_04715 [Puccinia coronata f. sp. avenae]|uniref:Uncharacterized protein n=1 Tax=Puccinia coronata f. sp. avenae TaxID=200324 RepID=A0A2N5W1I5_9BASI|nr:hypothetical protein PCANC_04715 [Puccinia coronata f. sp. avenae]
MDRLPASAAMGPGSYPITHGTEPGVIPEGHSVIQIAQPVCYPVWKPNPVPILYADHGRYEYEPATVLTYYVVPNTHLAPPHKGGNSVLRGDAVPFEPRNAKKNQEDSQNEKPPRRKKGSKRITISESHGFEGKASVQKQKMKPQPSEILNGGDPDRISDTIESNGQSPSTGSSKTIKSGKENTLKSAQSRNEVDSWITPKRYARTDAQAVQTEHGLEEISKRFPYKILNKHSDTDSELASLVNEMPGGETSPPATPGSGSEYLSGEDKNENQDHETAVPNPRILEKQIEDHQGVTEGRNSEMKKKNKKNKSKASKINVDEWAGLEIPEAGNK